MVKKLIIGLLIICFGVLHSQTPALSRISVKGNKFVTAEGTIIIFKGLNASDPDKLQRDGHWNKAYFAEAKNWGANIIRLPVHPTAWRKYVATDYLALLDQGIQWATELQLYVIIDLAQHRQLEIGNVSA